MVQPPNATLVEGETLGFTARATSDIGDPLPTGTVRWSSEAPLVVSIGADGTAEALKVGQGVITATLEGKKGQALVTVEPGPTISVDVPSISLVSAVGAAPPDPSVIQITNTGGGTLGGLSASVQYAQGGASNWLAIALGGTTAPTNLSVTILTGQLGAGTHDATILVSAGAARNSPVSIPVQVVLTLDQPLIQLTPSELEFEVIEGEAPPPPISVQVTNVGGGELSGLETLVSAGGWLSASLSATTAPTQVQIQPNPAGLEVGLYEGEVLVRSDLALNQGQLDVILRVVAPPKANLEVQKTGPATASFQDEVSYTVTLVNRGPDPAEDVLLIDSLPSNTTFVSASGGGVFEGERVTWDIGTLEVDGEVVETATVRIGATGVLENIVVVNSETLDPQVGNERSTVTTAVDVLSDLSIVKTGPDSGEVGDTISYLLEITNSGPDAATNTTVLDSLPSEVAFLSATGSGIHVGGVVAFSWASIAPGATVRGTIRAVARETGTFTNVAKVFSATPDPDEDDLRATQTTSITGADLLVRKTAPATADAGGRISYFLTVENGGPATATGVLLTDTLPAGVTFVSATTGGIHSGPAVGGVVTWDLGNLASGATAQGLSVVVDIGAGTSGAISNTGAVRAQTGDPDLTNNRSTASTNLGGSSDLTASKSGPVSAVPGSQLTYTVTVQNLGPSNTANVVVTDTLPPGVRFVSATGQGVHDGAPDGGVVTWTLSALSVAAAAQKFEVVVDVDPAVLGSLRNAVSVSSLLDDPEVGNNWFEVSTPLVGSADLGLTKSGPAAAIPGTQIAFTVTVTNNGPSDASGVVVTDVLPSGMTYSSSDVAPASVSGQTVTWPTLSTLARGASQAYSLTVNVASGATGVLINTASVATSTADPVPGNNAASHPVSVSGADLSVTKTVGGAVTAGTPAVYTITLTNNGPSEAQDVVLTDVIPSGALYSDASPAPASVVGQTVTWPTLSSLANGASRVYTLTVDIDPGISGDLTNSATASSATTVDPVPGNDTGTLVSSVQTQADVSVSKTVGGTVTAGGQAVYTLTVTNSGPSNAVGVALTDVLPVGMTFSSATPIQSSVVGQAVSWPTVGTLPAGESRMYTLRAGVAAAATGDLTNTASVSAATTDPSPANNNTNLVSTLAVSADVAVSKAGPVAATPGDRISYVVAVENLGPSDARGVVVTDPLPAGVTLVSQSQGTYDDGTRTVSWTVGDLPASAGAQSMTLEVDIALGISGSVTNTAMVVSSTSDPNAGNDLGIRTTSVSGADVSLTKTGPAAASPGQQITYTVVVENQGPSIATGVALADQLPVGVTFVSATGGGSHSAGVVTWPTLGSLTVAAGPQSYQVTVGIGAGTVGLLTNTATVTSTSTDPDPSDDQATAVTSVTSSDLAVTKTVGGPVTAGGQATYTVTVTNNGPSPASNVTVSDVLPAGMTYLSSNVTPTVNGQNITWPTLASLANGANQVYTLTVSVGAGVSGNLTNTATATSATTFDPVPGNNTGTLVSTVGATADLSVTKTGGATVTAGGQATYTVTVTNNGPSNASNVVVTDLMPAGMSFASSSLTPAVTGQTVTWPTLGTLANGASQAYTLTVNVSSGVTGTLNNTASVASGTSDPNGANNSGTRISTVVSSADLAITKTGGATVTAGGQATYTVTVTNNGPSNAVGVVVTDVLPAGMTFASSSVTPGVNGQTITWPTIATVANGSSQIYTLTVNVAPGTTGTLNNSVAVTSATNDPVASNNSATRSSTVGASADLAVTKTVGGTVEAGSQATYTITVTNNGPSNATNVVVTDVLPSGMSFASATPTQSSVVGQLVTWPTIGTLASGSSQIYTLTVNVSAGASGTLDNTASAASPTSDPNGSNNSAVQSSTVAAEADLSITKTGAATVTAGGQATYTVTVTNNGPSDATGIVVTDVLPAGMSFASSNVTPGVNGQTITWPTLGSLSNGASQVYTLTVNVASSATGVLNNTASVASVTTDPNGANDGAARASTVVTSADLAIIKTGAGTVTAGGQATYTITVSNNGPSDATNVVVTDLLPAGMTFSSSNVTPSVTGQTITWPTLATLADGASQVYALTVNVGGGATGTLINTAFVAGSTSDPDDTNDSASQASTVGATADVSVVKTVGGPLQAGSQGTYTITVTNNGPSNAGSVVVTDVLPSGITYFSSNVTPTVNGQTITWPTLGSLANGANQVYTLTVSVSAGASGDLTNLVTATSSTTPDPNGLNNTATQTSTVGASADLAITKTGAGTVTAGGQATYTLTVTNNGPSNASGVVVTDVLPAGMSFASSNVTPGVNGQTITWPTLGSLANGDSQVYTLTVNIAGGASGTLLNSASVTSSTFDPNASDNSATQNSTVGATADLSITKTGGATVTAGGQAIYTITVNNNGPSDASSVVVTDVLPTGMTFASSSVTPSVNGQTVTWPTVGTLANGGTLVYTLTVNVAGGATGTLNNTTSVTSATTDPNAVNNSAIQSSTVGSTADVSVTKTIGGAVEAGSQATYTVTVTNNGPSNAASVVVTDVLPTGMSYASATPTPTTVVGQTITWPTLASLANGASQVYTLTVNVSAGASGDLTNLVTASSSSTPDPNGANNTATQTSTVGATADLSIAKTGGAAVTAGGQATYTITVNNNGPSNASSVVVTDVLPAGMTFVSSNVTPSVNGQTITWPTVGTLSNGGSQVYTLTVDIASSASGTLNNTASVTSATPDTNGANDSATQNSSVTVSADLGLTKTVGGAVEAGSQATYTITLTNNGPSDASSVVVTDVLPAGMSYASATPTPSVNGQTITWPTLPTFADGASQVYTLTVNVSSGASGDLTNTASVASPTSDPSAANNTATQTSTVGATADLSIAKTGGAAVTAGGQATYTITVNNNGPSNASSVVVTDVLPAGMTFVSSNVTPSVNGQTITWPTVGTLSNGGSQVYTLTVDIASSASGTLNNTASVTSATPDTNGANDSSTQNSSVTVSADLGLTKTVGGAVEAGSQATYTITLTNNGPSDASSVVVTDVLPAGMSYASATPTPSVNGQTITWPTLPTFADGASQVYTLTVNVSSGASGDLTNTASVASPTSDPSAANNTATQTSTVGATADLSIAKTGGAAVTAGGQATYTITVNNNGPSNASSVVVTDVLPAGMTFVSSNVTPSVNGQTITWPTVGTLSNGGSQVYTLTVDIASSASGTLNNTASVTSATPDTNGANDSATQNSSVTVSADLGLTKTVGGAVEAGSQATYTITLTNNGPSDASSVVVTDVLPAGMSYASATPTPSVNGQTITWPTLPTFADGASQVYTLTVNVSSGASGDLTNTASVASPTSDPSAANNTATQTSTVGANADVSVSKTVNLATAAGGDRLTYTVTVQNTGPSDAANVIVTDQLPAGVTFVSATGGGAHVGGVVTWDLGTLTVAAGQQTYTLEADIGVTTVGTLLNQIQVTTTSTDSNPGNNTDDASTFVPNADVALTKTVDKAAATIGDQLTYTVTVQNLGPSDATDVVVSDQIPGGLTFISTSQGSYSGATRTVTWSLGTVTVASGQQTMEIVVEIPGGYAGGSVINLATASSTSVDPLAGNNIAFATTSVSGADLSVSKSVDLAEANPGDQVTYTITLQNQGPNDATGVTLTDLLPTGVSYVSANPIQDSRIGQTLTWNVGDLTVAAGQQTYTIVGSIDAGVVGSLQNTASVTSTSTDPDASDDQDTATTTALSGDLVAGATAPASATAGTQVDWGASVDNTGPDDAENVQVTMTLPGGVSFVSATGGGSHVGGVVTWNVGTLGPADPLQSFTVSVSIPAGTAVGTDLTHTVAVSTTTNDPDATDDSQQAATTVTGAADLVAGASAPATVLAGNSVVWGASVDNTGPSNAAGVQVTMTLPGGVSFVSATGGGAHNAGVVTWTVGNLAITDPVQNFSATVAVPAGTATGTNLTQTVAVSATTADPDATDNSQQATTSVGREADLVAGASAPPTATAGDQIVFGASVQNTGPSDAEAALVTMTLPTGVTYFSSSNGGSLGGSVVTWNIGTLTVAAGMQNYTVTVDIGLGTTGGITQTVDVSTTTTDPDGTDNQATAVTTVSPPPPRRIRRTCRPRRLPALRST